MDDVDVECWMLNVGWLLVAGAATSVSKAAAPACHSSLLATFLCAARLWLPLCVTFRPLAGFCSNFYYFHARHKFHLPHTLA